VGDSIKAGDLYTYSLDDWTSGQIARLTDIIGASSNYMDEGNAIQKMRTQLNRQDYAGVKQTYDQLPQKYQQNKFVLLVYIQACHHIDLGLYEKVLTDYSASFPDASSCYLLLLDLYYSKKEYDKALADIDKLDKVVGGDPLLNFLRGNAYALMGKDAESTGCYEKVYAYDPTLKINVLKLAGRYAATNQTDKARKLIAAYMETPGYHIGDFNTLYDDYPDLR
jgi:tetratricopeptide (TPR) repeat protein